jgi:hypothetical protein
MSEQKNALEAMLAQYEKNNAPKYEKQEAKTYDLKNYFNTYIPESVKSGTKTIRILPTKTGSPFVEMYGHKIMVDGEWKTFPCLKHEKDEACPFCEARQELLSTGKDSDKELAKKYNARLMYVVKVIDRDNEDEGVKFWRFNHDYSKGGVYDKLYAMITALKKDVTHSETGRDIVITISRNQNNVPIVSGIQALDPSVLSEDETKLNEWLSDERTWEDVYSVRTYDYLEIIVRGYTPVWDKEEKRFVAKELMNEQETKSNLESELTMGIENVKSNIQTQLTTETVSETSTEEDEDDLPF